MSAHRHALRRWSVRHAGFFEALYDLFAATLLALHPVLARIGYERLERPVAVSEHAIKGALFDCRMCGQCILGATGMSCSMNCPKSLRNGPCGGVRADGQCEVTPAMPCVWVDAWMGSRAMKNSDAILLPQPALDRSLEGSSSWLRATRNNERLRAACETAKAEARP